MTNEVQYIPVSRRILPTGPVAVCMWEALTEVAIDREQISPRLLQKLSAVSTAIVSELRLRTVPLAMPWGSVRLDLRDKLDLAEILPRVTLSGIIVPVPKQLLTVEVARGIERLGTETLRYYDPPDTGR